MSGTTLFGTSGADAFNILGFRPSEAQAETIYGGPTTLASSDSAKDSIFGFGGDDVLLGFGGDDGLSGGNGADSLLGGLGNDSLQADDSPLNAGADTVRGGSGDDLVTSFGGGDSLDGGAGLDILNLFFTAETSSLSIALAGAGLITAVPIGLVTNRFIGFETVILNLGSGNDRVEGAATVDVLIGNNGADTFSGFDGNDSLAGDDGDDVLSGGAGADTLFGGAGRDRLSGGGDNDVFLAGSGDTITGGLGTDIADLNLITAKTPLSFGFVIGVAGAATLSGGGDASLQGVEMVAITGGVAGDSLRGGTGADTLTGMDGADSLLGSGGADALFDGSGAFDDTLSGGDGADTLVSQGRDATFGGERVDGGADTDLAVLERSSSSAALGFSIAIAGAATITGDGTVVVGVEQIRMRGGFGADTLTGGTLADTLDGGADSVADRLAGSGGADLLLGFGGDTLLGGSGNDSLSLMVQDGGGWIVGGLGTDLLTLSYDGSQALFLQTAATATLAGVLPVTITDVERFSILAGSGADRITLGGDADTLDGGLGADTLSGGAGNDRVLGSLGADSLAGGGGNDYLAGGDGNDTLRGGLGSDRFLLDAPGLGADSILDFDSATDTLLFKRPPVPSDALPLGELGPLAAARLAFGSATTTEARFVVVSTELWWDPDGSGAQAATLLARFANPLTALNFVAADIQVIA
jgi:Ca2+-binding RTX toxin-like protein